MRFASDNQISTGGFKIGRPLSALAGALRWIAEEPLVYDQGANELHRPSCFRASGHELAPGDALELIWAPRMCLDCEPDVTMSTAS